jgi:hypothetical protein
MSEQKLIDIFGMISAVVARHSVHKFFFKPSPIPVVIFSFVSLLALFWASPFPTSPNAANPLNFRRSHPQEIKVGI